MSKLPTIAFVTMVRDDHFYLKLWVDYYARHVPRHHLFILLDGFDQTPPEFTAGCQIINLPRSTPGPGWDMRRWEMLNHFKETLLVRFDVIVLNDVDEIIVADPASGITLIDAVGRAQDVGVITPFAVEVVHRYDLCPEAIDPHRPILRQRPHVRVNEVYAKPCITSVSLRWNLGGHNSDFPKLYLDPVLYLFHLRFIDRAMLQARQATRLAIVQAKAPEDEVVAGAGWVKTLGEVDDFLKALQAHGLPEKSDFAFHQKRSRINAGWKKHEASGIWRLGRIHNRFQTYAIPDRFLDLI